MWCAGDQTGTRLSHLPLVPQGRGHEPLWRFVRFCHPKGHGFRKDASVKGQTRRRVASDAKAEAVRTTIGRRRLDRYLASRDGVATSPNDSRERC